ncbi:MAG: hypothetical protein ACLTK0_05025 [Anaerovoracaceae bacterium]
MIVHISAILIIASVIAANDAFGATKATVTASIGLNVNRTRNDLLVVSAIPYGGTFTIISSPQDGADWYKISVNGIQDMSRPIRTG